MKFPHLALAALVLLGRLAAETISITDTKGRTIEVELTSADDESVSFTRPGNNKEYSLPLTQLDEASQKLIKERSSTLAKPAPKLDIKVNIGKRRDKYNGSWYQVKQNINCNIDITNLSIKHKTPPLKGTILFIGQDRRTPDLYAVLSTQNFDIEVEPTKTKRFELKGFHTIYDSDNKGEGNVGGCQYDDYVFILTDENDQPLLHQSTSGNFNKAIAADKNILVEALKFEKGSVVSKDLLKLDNRNIIIRQ